MTRTVGRLLLPPFLLGGCHLVSGIDELELREDPQPRWVVAISGPGTQNVVGVSATPNQVYALVQHRGALTIGDVTLPDTGTTDLALVQYGATGKPNWMLSLVGPSSDRGRALLASNGGVVVGGVFRNSMAIANIQLVAPMTERRLFYASFVHDGSLLQAKAYGGDGFDVPSGEVSLALAPEGAIIVGGPFVGELDFGCGNMVAAGPLDAYIAKISDGECSWSKKLGDSKLQSVESVGAELGGDVVVAGKFAGSLDFGEVSLQSGGGIDAFVAKLDIDGKHRWSRRYGDSGGVVSSVRVAVHSLGNVTLSGLFQGSVDFGDGLRSASQGPDLFVVKLDPSGNHLWSTTVSLNRDPCSLDDCTLDRIDMVTDIDGSLILTGHFDDEVDFGGTELNSVSASDLYIAKLDVNGALLWSGSYGSSQPLCMAPDCVALAAVDRDRNIVIGGHYTAALDFGIGEELPADEEGGSYVLRLAR